MEIVLLIIRLVLFGVFALAGIGKLLDLKGSEKAVKDFGTPEEFAKTFAIAIPFAEIIFAFCFLFVSTSWVGALGGFILLLSFTGGMLWQMAQGNAPDCHCFGQISSEPISRKTLVRNIIFLSLALFLIAQGRGSQGYDLTEGSSSSMQLLLIFMVLALVAATLFYLKKVLDGQTEILRRIDLLEVVATHGAQLERKEAGSPSDGLPIGAPFPDFDLPTVSGDDVSLSTTLEKRLPSLFFFVSPTCEPCKALVPEMERWDAELGDRVNIVLVSSGTRDENKAKFSVFSDDVILQEDRELAESVYARWTPTAILVRADGTIGSQPAVGDIAIRNLVDKVRSEKSASGNFFVATQNGNGSRAPLIGKAIPEFSLPDANGKTVDSEHLIGRRTLAVFWSPTCPHCTAMMNELKQWDASRGESDPQLVVFSDGEAEAHRNLRLNAPVLLDENYETSEKLGMFGTPSAVVIDESGTIVSETAVGASNIWALIGKRK